MATIRDVARQAGLSVTTVSRALNNYDDVAKATRDRVRRVAETLDYHPSAVARNLQGSMANAIGLGIPNVLHRSYDMPWLEFIGGMGATCAGRGVDLLVSTADVHDVDGQGFQRLVRERRVDGLIICDIRCHDARIPYLQERRLPFIAFGRTASDLTYSFIDVDGADGMRQIMDHLIGLGHRRIAYLGLDPAFGFSHYRFAAYGAALQRAHLCDDPALVRHGLGEADVVAALASLLALPDPPTAVFAGADFLGLAVLRAARALGLAVPQDLSLAVFDDSLLVEHADPPLTAVGQSNRQLGEEAAALLLDRVAKPDLPLARRLVTPTLVVRRSTTSPRQGRFVVDRRG